MSDDHEPKPGKDLRLAWTAQLPDELRKLAAAQTEAEAEEAFDRVDNVAAVQGTLYEAAVPTVALAVALLDECTAVALPWLLDLMAELCLGSDAPEEEARGVTGLADKCRAAILPSYQRFLKLLDTGDETTRYACVDLVGLCALTDPTKVPSALQRLTPLANHNPNIGVRNRAISWLHELGIDDQASPADIVPVSGDNGTNLDLREAE